MHVPLLMRYNYESHAVAGALVGLGSDYLMDGHFSQITRLTVSVGAALLLGAVKEYLLDKHPNNREIAPWGLGAAASLSFKYSF